MRHSPICYHPTTIIILDDDLEYVMQLAFRLKKSQYSTKTFTSPYDFLGYLNNEYIPNYWIHRAIKEDFNVNHKYQQWAINLDLYTLPRELYNNNRFNQVSCVIVDYSMPGINGLDVLREIRDPYIKKILLTGIADESIAIEAFNKGEIDKFILKSEDNMFLNLSKAIDDLVQSHFLRLSNTALDIIWANGIYNTGLKETNFIKLLTSQIQTYNIVEYYLFEKFGCYIMIDRKGTLYGLFIYPESDVEAVLGDIDLNDDIQSMFNSTPQIMCYYDIEGPKFPVGKEKIKFLKQSNSFKGAFNTYYWAVTKQNIEIDKKKIISFAQYKKDKK